MWPLNAPAQDLLRLPGATSIPWAVFDAAWYRASWPDDTAHLADASGEAVLAFYLETGQHLGHSPNMLFDEAWHRRAYPGIAALVDAGQFPSAFDAWCRGGCLERSPHWLFDEMLYRQRNPDLTDDFLRRDGLVNGYDHYLWRGNAEGRIAHPLFDPTIYRDALDPSAAGEAAADGPFWHCLRRLHGGGAEVRTSARFDPDWYRRRYPDVPAALDRADWRWCLRHYLCNETPTDFDPLPVFSEREYLARYPDVAELVRKGRFRNGYAHFLTHGAAELRAPSATFDLAAYAAREDVRRDLERGIAEDAFTHYLTVGAGRHAAVAAQDGGDARTLFERRARVLSVAHARSGLDFTTTAETPALSAIMVPRDRFALTMQALGALRAGLPGAIDLVLIDPGSTDETRDIQRYLTGATYFRFDTPIGELAARDAALQFATGEVVLFLDSGVEPAPGAVAAALRRLENDPRIGAVCGMILRPDGTIWQAGGMLSPDGVPLSRCQGEFALAPEANFAREVDFGSSVFLLARRALLTELEGFDAALTPGPLADADLCLRMRDAGFPVIYDPAMLAYYLEPEADAPEADADAIERARQHFTEKHGARPSLIASEPGSASRHRVLFVEDTIPLRALGSGYVRSNDILRQMAGLGHAVTVYPLNGSRFDVASVHADMPDTVEVIRDGSPENFPAFLESRRAAYDVIWLARTHNLGTVREALARVFDDRGDWPPVILDTEAIAARREAERAVLAGEPFDLAAAVRAETRDAAFCAGVVAISATEAALLRDAGLPQVAVIGHMREPRPTPRPFDARAGMLFVGAIHHLDSPNYDSLCWFVDQVLPLIARELTWETRLTVAGYLGPDVTLDRFRDHPRVTLRGPISDLTPLYDAHRVFVAPTRIAAGMPYKVHEAASFGLPVVTTELLRDQLDWSDGGELLAADAGDPRAFADRAVALQRDPTLWLALREAALQRIRRDNNPADYAAAIQAVLDAAYRQAAPAGR